MPLNPGAVLGPYEVAALIGTGGMGEVYKARDVRLDRTVAIKMLPAALAEDPDTRVRFEREARAVAALNHPHICTLYDVGPDYLVMELVDGQPLAGPLPLARALEFASQILSALDAAHGKGITHRDLKPSNILVTKQGVKLLDFGLAKVGTSEAAISMAQSLTHTPSESPTRQQTLTGEHMILGTVHYMSPEQAQGKPADARSDIFSFGLVLYEMLTGRRAFDGANAASVIAAIIERETPSAAAVAPPALDRVLQKCLAKDPSERWQTARDIRHALDLVEETPGAAGTVRRGWKAVAFASIAGFAVASALALALYATWLKPEVESRRVSFQLTPPARADFQFSPTLGGAVISPDGRSVAFVAITNGTPRLWIRTLDSLVSRELQDTDGAKLPFWSPDNGAVGFFANGNLRRIDVAGGAAVLLAQAPDPRGGTWNTDGTIVFSPNASSPLRRVSASGGTPSQLTTLADGETTHRWPDFLPDGRTLLYYISGDNPGAYLTTLDHPGNTKRVVQGPSEVRYFPLPGVNRGYLLGVVRDTLVAQLFDPASAQLVGAPRPIADTEDVASFSGTNRASMSVSKDGTLLYGTGGTRFRLAWFGPDGAPLGGVGETAQYIGLRLSPAGSDALVTIRDGENGDLWRVDLTRGARSRITSGGQGWYGSWSPDGQQVAFSSLNGAELLAASARGAGQVDTLLTNRPRVFTSDWSRDGQYLAFTGQTPESSNDVFLLTMKGERKAVPLLDSSFTEFHPQFSPDGGWLAFTSEESGRQDVYVQSFPDGRTRRLVSSGGGSYPRWGRDGRELFYRAADGQLVAVPLRTIGSSVELGSPRVIMRLVDPPAVHPYPYDVAADGRILALTAASDAAQGLALTVRMNWQAALDP